MLTAERFLELLPAIGGTCYLGRDSHRVILDAPKAYIGALERYITEVIGLDAVRGALRIADADAVARVTRIVGHPPSVRESRPALRQRPSLGARRRDAPTSPISEPCPKTR